MHVLLGLYPYMAGETGQVTTHLRVELSAKKPRVQESAHEMVRLSAK